MGDRETDTLKKERMKKALAPVKPCIREKTPGLYNPHNQDRSESRHANFRATKCNQNHGCCEQTDPKKSCDT